MSNETILNKTQLSQKLGIHPEAIRAALKLGALRGHLVDGNGKPLWLLSRIGEIQSIFNGGNPQM
jgi:hypothetical protein